MTNKEAIIRNVYYDPERGLTGIDDLHMKLKPHGITKKQIRDFLNKQQSYQLHKKPTRVHHYFPIHCKREKELMQIDLADFSDIAGSNNGVKYLLACIDVFTRKGYMIPLHNKNTSTIILAIKELFKHVVPENIMCDKGSEFISKEFKTLIKNNNVNLKYTNVKDYNREGCINRFIQTIRSRINKYLTAYGTSKYIDVLPKIINNYNNSYNSGIEGIPSKPDSTHILELMTDRYIKALEEEVKFNVGDRVRYVINSEMFQKGSLPRWSKTIHSISESKPHSYILDNGKEYKYYQLQKINAVELHEPRRTRAKDNEKSIQQLRRSNTIKRRLNKEGVDLANVTTGKRTIKQTDRYHT